MARLYEYQGKRLLDEAGVPVPKGKAARTPEEAKRIAEEIGGAVAIKAQVWSTGRLKAGGIRFADTPEESEEAARALMGSEVKGLEVGSVLVEEKLDIEEEYYAGVIVDNSYEIKAPIVMFSTEGGVDIEETAEKHPEKIARKVVDIFEGVEIGDAHDLPSSLKVPERLVNPISEAIVGLYQVFRKYGASSAEINPLVLTEDGRIVAADCRISIDDSSVPLHPELLIDVARESVKPPTELDKIAWKVEEKDYRGVFYFMQLEPETEGCVGYHGIGGGGSLVGADALVRAGFKVANFADTSGNPTASKVYRCAKITLSQHGIEGYLLGGFCVASQEQWHHAHGLVKALREELAEKPGFPVVLVIAGNKEKETIKILEDGLKDLPIKLEIYGRDYIDKSDYVAERMKALIGAYKAEKRVGN